jgi:flagellar assembly protein FliH
MPPSDNRAVRRPEFLRRASAKPVVETATFRPTERSAAHLRVVDDPEPEGMEADRQAELAASVAAAAAATAQEQIAAVIAERIGSAVETLRLTSERLAADARTDALELGFLIARRVLEGELTASVEPMVALVRSAVRRLGESRVIKVRLAPADALAVNTVLAARGASAVAPVASAQIEVLADAALERGDCVVEGELGTVDGRLDTRLEELRRALTEELQDSEGGA